MSDKKRVVMNLTVEELEKIEVAVGSSPADGVAIAAYREIRDAQKRLMKRLAKAGE